MGMCIGDGDRHGHGRVCMGMSMGMPRRHTFGSAWRHVRKHMHMRMRECQVMRRLHLAVPSEGIRISTAEAEANRQALYNENVEWMKVRPLGRTCACRCAHAHGHAVARALAHACVCACMCVRMHVCAHACVCACICVRMHLCAHACVCACTCTGAGGGRVATPAHTLLVRRPGRRVCACPRAPDVQRDARAPVRAHAHAMQMRNAAGGTTSRFSAV